MTESVGLLTPTPILTGTGDPARPLTGLAGAFDGEEGCFDGDSVPDCLIAAASAAAARGVRDGRFVGRGGAVPEPDGLRSSDGGAPVTSGGGGGGGVATATAGVGVGGGGGRISRIASVAFTSRDDNSSSASIIENS